MKKWDFSPGSEWWAPPHACKISFGERRSLLFVFLFSEEWWQKNKKHLTLHLFVTSLTVTSAVYSFDLSQSLMGKLFYFHLNQLQKSGSGLPLEVEVRHSLQQSYLVFHPGWQVPFPSCLLIQTSKNEREHIGRCMTSLLNSCGLCFLRKYSL